MKKTHDWRDGRLVFRRPEARNSVTAKACLELSRAELDAMSRTLRKTVEQCQAMTEEEWDAELLALAELDRRTR